MHALPGVAPEEQRRDRGEQQDEAAASGIARHPARQSWHGGKIATSRPREPFDLRSRMFDDNYFRTTLVRDVEATGGNPVVEIQLLSGHAHRVRTVVEVGAGYVTLETYLAKGDLAHERPRFGEATAESARDTFRTVIAYESIAAVVLDPQPSQVRARPGFASS